jgi:uncharacterized protein
MHLIIDGYNLLHVNRSMASLTPLELQQERDRLIGELSTYRNQKASDITVVFDGWQGGWVTEKTEKRRGIEIVFSKLGEKADEVIKRRIRERGTGSVLISSDRELLRYAERLSVSAISSEQFRERMESAAFRPEKGRDDNEEEEGTGKRKGPSRTLSKREKRARAALKKL